ncbi:MAG: hypothetical protein OXT69_05060 [Candidatus Poribacteria bacterium]|nr:hypothetical protein [Candidatus Poribacteria bacterium]
MYPPPRVNRLHKAALAFLAAATAAFFVGAPGNTAIPTTSLITQITVSATDIFEGDSHTTTASLLTNLNGESLVDRVVWTVEADGDDDPEHTWTDDDPGVSSDFDFAYDDLGSTTGAAVVVEAVAFDAEDNSDTAQATINVWKKSETVSIVSQTSDHDLVDGSTADVFVQTDVGFWKVEWSVDGSSLPTDNGPGLTSQITYDFSSVSHGSTVTFTATPYGVNADGDEVAGESATIAVSVWKPIYAMLYVPEKCVEDESIDISLATTVPFDWVEYVIEGAENNEVDPSNETSDMWSEIDHTFAIGGDQDGSPRTVTAVATYVTPSGTVVKSRPETATVKLYDNHGFQWRRMISRVDSFYNVLDDRYIFTSGHTIEYYYDGNARDFHLRRKARWFEDGNQHEANWPDDESFFTTPAFWESVTLPMDTPATLTRDREYYVEAYTNYGAGNAPAEVESEKAFYNPEAADPLPIPTGKEDESENPNLPDALK